MFEPTVLGELFGICRFVSATVTAQHRASTQGLIVIAHTQKSIRSQHSICVLPGHLGEGGLPEGLSASCRAHGAAHPQVCHGANIYGGLRDIDSKGAHCWSTRPSCFFLSTGFPPNPNTGVALFLLLRYQLAVLATDARMSDLSSSFSYISILNSAPMSCSARLRSSSSWTTPPDSTRPSNSCGPHLECVSMSLTALSVRSRSQDAANTNTLALTPIY